MLSSFLMDEMNKSTVFKVIDLEMSDQVEKLLAFANSDKCDQNQCHIPVGNIIPAQKLLAGTLSRLGKVYVLNVRLIDIEKKCGGIQRQRADDGREGRPCAVDAAGGD